MQPANRVVLWMSLFAVRCAAPMQAVPQQPPAAQAPLVPQATPAPPPEPATPPAPPQQQGPVPGKSYIVQPGDTLSGIAACHSTAALPVSLPDLLALNHFKNANRILVGRPIVLPEGVEPKDTCQAESPHGAETRRAAEPEHVDVQPNIHVVQRGETLTSIGVLHGKTPAYLKHINHLDSDRVRVGQRIHYSEPPPPPPPPVSVHVPDRPPPSVCQTKIGGAQQVYLFGGPAKALFSQYDRAVKDQGIDVNLYKLTVYVFDEQNQRRSFVVPAPTLGKLFTFSSPKKEWERLLAGVIAQPRPDRVKDEELRATDVVCGT